MNIDYDFDNQKFSNKSGEYRLWLRVTLNAIDEYLHSKFSSKLAENFLFDVDNQFFEMVAESLGYEPEALRQRIRKAKQRCNT